MNGTTVSLAAALGMQLSNLLWDAAFAVLCLLAVCFLAALVFEGIVIWDMLRKPVTHLVLGALPDDTPEVGDSVRMLTRWHDDDVIAQLERDLAEGEQDA